MSSYRMKYKIGNTEFITTVPSDINEKVINKRVEITSSGTWIAPFTSWYKFTLKGAGAGGSSGSYITSIQVSGGGWSGGEGGTTFAYAKLQQGDSVSITIGAGGAGGVPNSPSSEGTVGTKFGTAGGNTTVTINGTTYTAGGGGTYTGGTGTINGVPSLIGGISTGRVSSYGSHGAGSGGGCYTSTSGTKGGGGAGGYAYYFSSRADTGGKGGDGYCWIEYFDPTL